MLPSSGWPLRSAGARRPTLMLSRTNLPHPPAFPSPPQKPQRRHSGCCEAARCATAALMALWGVFLSASAHAQQSGASPATAVALTNSMAVLDDKRPLQPGDRLSIRIVEDREPPVAMVVTDSGEVEAPYIGRVRAQGRTCRQLAYAIKEALDREYYYNSTVIIGLDSFSNRPSGVVYIRGAVGSPGTVAIQPGEPLLLSKAILSSGGFGPYANKRKVQVMRKDPAAPNGSSILTVDMVEVLERGNRNLDVELKADDIVTVPERAVRF